MSYAVTQAEISPAWNYPQLSLKGTHMAMQAAMWDEFVMRFL